jgi:hypothetical protein
VLTLAREVAAACALTEKVALAGEAAAHKVTAACALKGKVTLTGEAATNEVAAACALQPPPKLTPRRKADAVDCAPNLSYIQLAPRLFQVRGITS